MAEALARRGAVVVEAEKLSVPQLITQLFGARIIISIEGSQLSHALYTLCDESGIVVIQPPDRFFNSHMDWARSLNVRYGDCSGRTTRARISTHQSMIFFALLILWMPELP